MNKEGKQGFKVIDTDEKWILYHNCFSLCSRKVRLCLEELEIEYYQQYIDLIETGKYQVASKNFLKINPGATVPVLLHEGYPIYESHEQIYYLFSLSIHDDGGDGDDVALLLLAAPSMTLPER